MDHAFQGWILVMIDSISTAFSSVGSQSHPRGAMFILWKELLSDAGNEKGIIQIRVRAAVCNQNGIKRNLQLI